ncbi:MAG TPA: hypothetical protein VGQ72_14585 [Pyrinomonadaceae bacterium]|jgi:hypothetical protein|nr:hypothetical protein [Pyrinomonadaceae bacterium]
MNDALPGADLIEAGVRDLHAGRETVEALLVAIGAPRLRRIGLDIPSHNWEYSEMRLYELLARSNSDSAHSRYNALIRRLVSYAQAAEFQQGITLRMKVEEAVRLYSGNDFPIDESKWLN